MSHPTSGTTTSLVASTPDAMNDCFCHSDGTQISCKAFNLQTQQDKHKQHRQHRQHGLAAG
jgi:hypothetical protein